MNAQTHIHIPIPGIEKGKNGTFAQVPGTNHCIVCGDIVTDLPIVAKEYNKFRRQNGI